MIKKINEGDLSCGKGPVLSYGPAVQNNLLDFIINTADKEKIKFQRLAASRSTGTDTDAFAYSNSGVASALISLPLRYMHTTVEMCAKKDVENVIKLIYHCLLNLKANQDFKYLYVFLGNPSLKIFKGCSRAFIMITYRYLKS